MSELFVFDIPLNVSFRGINRRSGIVFRGEQGWAEWSPFVEYDDHEALVWLLAAEESAEKDWPEPLRDRIAVNGIVPALPPEQAAQRALASGCSTIKIKVADGDLAADLARVKAIREALPHAALRVDANGAWSLSEATRAVAQLAEFNLEYVEQPCATVEELAQLRKRELGVAIAADESIRRAEDPLRVRDAEAADVAIVKVQPLGGVRNCLSLAQQLELPVVVSSAVETSVGLRAGLALAAALPELPFACGLETARLLNGDLTSTPLQPHAGELVLNDITVEPELLERYAANAELTAWWRQRWQRVHRLKETDE